MNYNVVSAAEIVARISEDYNINFGDYINRVPQWIIQALNELDVNIAFIPTYKVIPLVDRIGILPTNIKVITGVEGNGVRLNRIHGISKDMIPELNYDEAITMTSLGSTIYGTNTVVDGDIITTTPTKIRTYNNETILDAAISSQYDYILLPNGRVEVNQDIDEVIVYYLSQPIFFDKTFGFQAPFIPDNEQTKVALTYYVLRNILMRGYKHPILKLGQVDPEYDPAKQWTKWKLIARNNLSQGDSEENDILSRLWGSYFYNSIF